MAEYIASFAQLLVAFASLGGLFISWKNNKAIEVIHHATNGMKDELVAEVRKAAKAEGTADGIAQERADPKVSSK